MPGNTAGLGVWGRWVEENQPENDGHEGDDDDPARGHVAQVHALCLVLGLPSFLEIGDGFLGLLRCGFPVRWGRSCFGPSVGLGTILADLEQIVNVVGLPTKAKKSTLVVI